MSLSAKLALVVTRIKGETKSIREAISGSPTGDASGLQTAANAIVPAINEVRATANAAAVINDAVTNVGNTWSSDKIAQGTTALSNQITQGLQTENNDRVAGDAQTLTTANAYTDTKIAALMGGIPPETLNSIAELATQMQADEAGAATIAGNLATLTTSVGNSEQDLVAVFNAA